MILEEYNEDEHSKELYAYFGLAVFHAQVLEHQLVNMIVLMKYLQKEVITSNDIEQLYSRKLSNTMGKLINEIKQIFWLEDDEVKQHKTILEKRNFIVHDYFKDRIALAYSKDGRDSMIIELKDFIEQAKITDNKLERFTDDMSSKVGVTKEMLIAQLDKMMAKDKY
ncbi:hypothetical protein Desde_0866 [Desulfitobacterium dehalogenans ATCC 51507]|uniref:Cthe-2314-like HEPN domain-containing protein n=1 Tax=Desulfitobacterium dehalogenans (strain ATCC 51507 / DSM 9161 / JW/IU-DC1) TaxID=756499 RepID=I4A5S2_DESDJ|nr:hypothetical protein Desde_0866 [Desulfitobacterium dehalogenans ATCC 51507]